jgi:hypothetical protein
MHTQALQALIATRTRWQYVSTCGTLAEPVVLPFLCICIPVITSHAACLQAAAEAQAREMEAVRRREERAAWEAAQQQRAMLQEVRERADRVAREAREKWVAWLGTAVLCCCHAVNIAICLH